jgi:hypothetical protein
VTRQSVCNARRGRKPGNGVLIALNAQTLRFDALSNKK